MATSPTLVSIGPDASSADGLVRVVLDALAASSGLALMHGEADRYPGADHDIDGLVDASLLPRRVLRGVPSGIELVQHIQHETTAHYFVLADRRERAALGFLALDVASDVRRRGRVYFAAHALPLAARRSTGGLRLEPAVAFVAYLIKRVDKLALPSDAAKELSSIYAGAPHTCTALLERYWPSSSARRLASAASTGEWHEVELLLPNLRRELRRRAVLRHPIGTARYYVADVPRVVRRMQRPTGLHVVLLGPDGTGKSSVARLVESRLAPAFRRTEVRHLRPGLVGRRSPRVASRPYEAPAHSRATSVLKALMWLLDYTVGYALHVRPALTQSTLVVFDRYLDDTLADPRRYRYGGPRRLLEAMRTLAPRPDLLLILDAPAEVLQARKQEVSFAESAQQRAAYLALASRDARARVIDASRSLEQVAADAVDAVLDVMAARASRRVGIEAGA